MHTIQIGVRCPQSYILRLFQIPEDMENFTITVSNATGGARLGNILTASLQINKNDDPIYFSGKCSFMDTVYEGDTILIYYSYGRLVTPFSSPCLSSRASSSPQNLWSRIFAKGAWPTSLFSGQGGQTLLPR